MLRKVIAAWVLGLGLTVGMTASSATAQTPQEFQDLKDDVKKLILDSRSRDARLQRLDDDIDEIKRLLRHSGHSGGSSTSSDTRPPPRVVHIHRHYYYPRDWCPPPWWGPW